MFSFKLNAYTHKTFARKDTSASLIITVIKNYGAHPKILHKVYVKRYNMEINLESAKHI